MALTGILKGDFSSFVDAVAKAEVALKGFEGNAGKVQTALNKMGDSFSGRKIISDAELATKAVTEIGGATKLTASEQAKLNAILTEAIAKYTALGAEAPKDMVALAEATKKVETATVGAKTATTDILGTVSKFAGAVGIGFSVGAVINFGKSVLNTAAQVHDMAEQLGISAEATQGFKFAAEQAGSSLETVGTALTKMNQNLATGSNSTVAALKAAGLAFSDIRQLSPEEAFLAITDAIQQIPDPMMQTQVAMQLFGRSAAELLPAIKEGFRETSDSAVKMSNDAVRGLEAIGDAWDKVKAKVTAATGEMINDAIKFLNVWQRMKDDIDRGTPTAPNGPKGPAFGATDLGINEEELKRAETALDGVRAKLDAVATAHANLIKNSREQIFGTTTINAAKTYVEALGSIGNLSKVNSVEQEKINKSIGEALDVYARFGKVAPQAMRDLYIATARIPDAIAGIPAGVGKIGEQFDLVIPKITDASKLLNYMAGIPFGVKVGQQVDFIPPKLREVKVDLGELSQALSQLATISGGTFGGMTRDLSQLVAAANAAAKGMREVAKGSEDIHGGDKAAGILELVAGISDITAAAVAAGKAIGSMFSKIFDRNKGRDVVVDFAETLGGFDALHVKLLELGADGEALWIKLTQGVGRNNPEQAQRVIDEVTQALDDQAAKSDDAKSATEEQAQATIETATQAAKALDELGGKLDISKDQWKAWGLAVTGVLQQIANTVRSLPMPSPAGSLPFSAGSNAGTSSTAGGGSAAGQETTVVIPLTIDGAVLAQSVVKVARRL